jgi:predicted RNase H-like HicB family nuclease
MRWETRLAELQQRHAEVTAQLADPAVLIDPERLEDGQIIFVASHPEFDGVLGTGESPEAALADLHEARRSMIEALLAEG